MQVCSGFKTSGKLHHFQEQRKIEPLHRNVEQSMDEFVGIGAGESLFYSQYIC